MNPDFVWPSDADRAENDELNRVCEYLEEVLCALEVSNERIRVQNEKLDSAQGAKSYTVSEIEAQGCYFGVNEALVRLEGGPELNEGDTLYSEPQSAYSAQGAEPVADFRAEIRTERDAGDEYQSFLVLVSGGKPQPYMYIPEMLDDTALDEALKRLNNTQPQSAGVPTWCLEELARQAESSTIEFEATYDDGFGSPEYHDVHIEERVADWIRAQKKVSATPQPAGDAPDACYWHGDDNGCWKGSCGIEWYFEDGDPDDNGVNHCPRCGRPRVNEEQEGS